MDKTQDIILMISYGSLLGVAIVFLVVSLYTQQGKVRKSDGLKREPSTTDIEDKQDIEGKQDIKDEDSAPNIKYEDYNHEFGPEGTFAWPSDLDVAERFIEAAPYAKSGPDCLTDYFFYEYLDCIDAPLFYEYPEEEALQLAEAAAKARQELFKDARDWPLPCLVASAVYKMLSAETEQIHMIRDLWGDLFWLFLCFDQPLSDMVKAKGWGKIYRKEIREGFKLQLWCDIRGFTGTRLMWGSDKDRPWLTRKNIASHIYAEDVLRCLDLVGVDPALAHSAVDKVFKLQSLTPLYDVFSDDPFSTRATVVKGREKGEEGSGKEVKSEEGETKNPKKPLGYLPIHVRHFIYGALLVAVAAIASNRLRLSRSNWALTRPGPCFASTLNSISRLESNQGTTNVVSQGPQEGSSIERRSRLTHLWRAVKNRVATSVKNTVATSKRQPILPLSRTRATLDGCEQQLWNNCRVEGDVSALETQVSVLKGKSSVSESELSAAKSDLSALESQPSVLKSELSALKSELSALKSELSALEGQSSVEIAQEPQSLSKLQKVIKVARTKSEEAREREKKWVNNVRILTDDSTPIKEYRAREEALGKHVEGDLIACVRAERTKKDGIVVTTIGTGGGLQCSQGFCDVVGKESCN